MIVIPCECVKFKNLIKLLRSNKFALTKIYSVIKIKSGQPILMCGMAYLPTFGKEGRTCIIRLNKVYIIEYFDHCSKSTRIRRAIMDSINSRIR